MGEALWDRICEVYSEAQVLAPAEREGLLSRMCDGDAELEREVRALLHVKAPPSKFLERSHVRVSPNPLPNAPSRTPGEVLSGRFEIVRFVGAGGMGEVYEATDRELDEHVAVKVLRPGQLPDDVLETRLRREIRLARKINHPNVCRVFDFARHELPAGGTLNYYVMELLHGETLAARLTRQLPDPTLACEIAQQMSDGLSAAHRAGIVHRDFKPANVMLIETPADLRVAVMDFGLAAPIDSSQIASSLGSTGLLLGTPGYIAPEQLYGGPVTPATDVYAYGIVLHELITGMHPRAETAASAPLPGHWKSVISRCMELDPKTRFASVSDAYTALVRPKALYWMPSRRAFLVGGGAVIASLSLLAAGSRLYDQTRPLPAGALMVVSPVENTTGDSRFDGLTAALQSSLAQSAHLNVWNPERTGQVLRAMRLEPSLRLDAAQWREIAFREGAAGIVFSTVSRVGAGYVLSINSERTSSDPRQPAESRARSFPASGPDGLFEALHEAGSWIRQTAGEDAAAIAGHNRLPQDITSNNWQALELFSHAQALGSAGQTTQAIPVLRRAVELDSQFAMGFMRLGDILNAQRMSEEGFELWRQAIKLARSQRLSEHEQLNIESRYAFETHDFTKAESALTEWVRRFPNDALAPQLFSSCLLDLGRFPEAVRRAQEALAKFGPSIFCVGVVLRGLAASLRLDETDAPLSEMDRLSPSSWGPQFRGAIAAIRGDRGRAEKSFRQVDPESRSLSLLAVLAGDVGDLDGAGKLLREGIKKDRLAGEHGYASAKATQLAFLEGVRGDRSAARLWALEALKEVRSPRNVTLNASTLARHGFLDDARRLLADFPKQTEPLFLAARWRIEGEILAAGGDFREAVARMEQSSKASRALEGREFLARALDLAGEKDQAHNVYEDLVNTPWIIWNNPEFEWPGIRYLASMCLSKT